MNNEATVVVTVEMKNVDKSLQKAERLVGLIKEANSLADELASVCGVLQINLFGQCFCFSKRKVEI